MYTCEYIEGYTYYSISGDGTTTPIDGIVVSVEPGYDEDSFHLTYDRGDLVILLSCYDAISLEEAGRMLAGLTF